MHAGCVLLLFCSLLRGSPVTVCKHVIIRNGVSLPSSPSTSPRWGEAHELCHTCPLLPSCASATAWKDQYLIRPLDVLYSPPATVWDYPAWFSSLGCFGLTHTSLGEWSVKKLPLLTPGCSDKEDLTLPLKHFASLSDLKHLWAVCYVIKGKVRQRITLCLDSQLDTKFLRVTSFMPCIDLSVCGLFYFYKFCLSWNPFLPMFKDRFVCLFMCFRYRFLIYMKVGEGEVWGKDRLKVKDFNVSSCDTQVHFITLLLNLQFVIFASKRTKAVMFRWHVVWGFGP